MLHCQRGTTTFARSCSFALSFTLTFIRPSKMIALMHSKKTEVGQDVRTLSISDLVQMVITNLVPW